MNFGFKPNQIINDRYKLVDKLLAGGMGVVWTAVDMKNPEFVVAIKMFHRISHRTFCFEQRSREMQKLAACCPFLLPVHETGNVEMNDLGNFGFYTMNYCSRGNLRGEIGSGGRAEFSPASFKWLSQVAHALDYAHSQGFWHFNVKPDNILYSDCGCAWLSDFGGLYYMPLFEENEEIDAEIDPLGWRRTEQLPYIFPILLEPITKNHTRADQFALAVTLFEFISGEPPYSGDTIFDYLESQALGHQKSLEAEDWITERASAAVDRALALEPDQQFESCSEFAKEFIEGI